MARLATTADASDITALVNRWLEAYGADLSYEDLPPWTEADAVRNLEHPNHRCYVWEDRKGVVRGFLLITINEEPHRVAVWAYDPEQNQRQQWTTIADMGYEWLLWERELGSGRRWASVCPIGREHAVTWLEYQRDNRGVDLSLTMTEPPRPLYLIEGGVDSLIGALEGQRA